MNSLTIHLTPEMVEKMNVAGRLRSPVEACGIILPRPKPGQNSASQVIELPNRSLEQAAYKIEVDDIRLELGPEISDRTLIDHLAIWHTHPAGNVGPSRSDMQKRREGLAYLVVALQDDGTAIPSWF